MEYIPYNMIYPFNICLEAAAGGSLVSSPTIAAGDFKVYIDNDAGSNLDTLPTKPNTYSVLCELSALESTGHLITVTWEDAAGAEWLPGYKRFLAVPPELLGIQLQGTAQAGAGNTTTSIILKVGTIIVNDDYVGCVIEIIKGTGKGQQRTITGTVASTQVATVATWSTPDATSVYDIYLLGVTSNYPLVTIASGTDTGEIDYIIDRLLNYDFTTITDTNQRSTLNALRRLINKVALVGSTLTVYKEDDAEAAYTQAVTTSNNVGAIVELNTVEPV